MVSNFYGELAEPRHDPEPSSTSPTHRSTLTSIPADEAPEPLHSKNFLYDNDSYLVKRVVTSLPGNTTTYFP